MAQEYEIKIPAHKNIYTSSLSNRMVDVFFSLPEKVNYNTGILILVAGFGGNAQSNVYRKMRNLFADENNLVVLQTNYFGYEFMQGSDITAFNKLMAKPEIASKIMSELSSGQKKFNIVVEQEESLENFADMGIMQALDIINALLEVLNIMYDNELPFNTNKIIFYGHSHGAFLGYLVNRFAPGLIKFLVDISAWTQPVYLVEDSKRLVKYINNDLEFFLEYSYLGSKIGLDKEIINLEFLYSGFENKLEVFSYHGIEDGLVTNLEKERFFSVMKNRLHYTKITPELVDNEIFKGAGHGEVDLIKIFWYTLDRYKEIFEAAGKSREIFLPRGFEIKTSLNTYSFKYEKIFPKLIIKK